MAFRLLMTWILVLSALPALGAEVDGFRVWADPDKTRAVLDLDNKADYQLFTLENPPRVVIDLKKSALDDPLKFDREHAGIIDNVRHGKPKKDTLRVVLDLASKADIKSFMLDPTGRYGYRLVVDLFPEGKGSGQKSIKTISDVQKTDRDIVVAIEAGQGGEDPGATFYFQLPVTSDD